MILLYVFCLIYRFLPAQSSFSKFSKYSYWKNRCIDIVSCCHHGFHVLMDLELVSLMIYLHRSCKLRLIGILANEFLATKFFSYVAHAITSQHFGRNSLFVCMSCWICFGENCRLFWIWNMSDTHFEFIFTLQVWGPSYLGLSRSILWLLPPG